MSTISYVDKLVTSNIGTHDLYASGNIYGNIEIPSDLVVDTLTTSNYISVDGTNISMANGNLVLGGNVLVTGELYSNIAITDTLTIDGTSIQSDSIGNLTIGNNVVIEGELYAEGGIHGNVDIPPDLMVDTLTATDHITIGEVDINALPGVLVTQGIVSSRGDIYISGTGSAYRWIPTDTALRLENENNDTLIEATTSSLTVNNDLQVNEDIDARSLTVDSSIDTRTDMILRTPADIHMLGDVVHVGIVNTDSIYLPSRYGTYLYSRRSIVVLSGDRIVTLYPSSSVARATYMISMDISAYTDTNSVAMSTKFMLPVYQPGEIYSVPATTMIYADPGNLSISPNILLFREANGTYVAVRSNVPLGYTYVVTTTITMSI